MKDYREYLFPISLVALLAFAVYLFFVINWIIVLLFIIILLVVSISILLTYMDYIWWPQSTWIDRSLVDIKEVEVPTTLEGHNLKGLVIRKKNADPNEKQIGVLFHHGYSGQKEFYFQFYIPLALNGCTILCIDARGHGKSKVKAFQRDNIALIMSDVEKEISFLENLDGIDPDNLIMMGHSLGGTASLTRGFQDTRIKKIVSMSAPYDHIELFEKHKTITARFIRRNFRKGAGAKEITNEWNEKISAKYYLDTKQPIPNEKRVFLIHCKHDDLVPFEQALKIKEVLELPDENVLFLEKPDFKYWMSAHNLIGQATIITDFLLKVIKK